MTDTGPAPDAQPDQVRVRRAPKMPAFLIVGGGIGAVVTFILTALFPVDPAVGFAALFAYFSLFGVTAGVLVGALVALILDRVASRRAKTVTAERQIVPPVEEQERSQGPDAS